MKRYLLIILVLFFIYVFTIPQKSYDKDIVLENVKEKEEVLAMVSYNDSVFTLSLNDYLIGVLACEMPASFNIEALKAGAVAARTFYLYKAQNEGYVASSIDQCYIDENGMRDKWGVNFDKYFNIVSSAIIDTNNEVIIYNDNIIQSFYFSISNGYTENVENVFGSSKPYLVSVESVWDKNTKNYESYVSFDYDEFLSKLELPSEEKIEIEIISKFLSGRVDRLTVNNVEFLGTNFRKLLGIRSTDFDIYVKDKVYVTTRGFGHGVGMSQYGANEMAKMGYNYKDIIKYYYKGTEISSL